MNVYVCESAVGQHWVFPEYITLGQVPVVGRAAMLPIEWGEWSRKDIQGQYDWLVNQFEMIAVSHPLPKGMSIGQLSYAIRRCCENMKEAPNHDTVSRLVTHAKQHLRGFGTVKARDLGEWWAKATA